MKQEQIGRVRAEQGESKDAQVDDSQERIGLYLGDRQQNCGGEKGSGANHAWIYM